ncbi:hypothetical protein TWF718_005749 [Orbilia javanica]|uniref:Rhodopsin domain-containing protein n=1 Tax=Orbilia javanica TaxID=47235 RepID=A0AAN8MSD6_9PEZI
MSDTEDFVWTPRELSSILSTSVWIGAGSPKYSHLQIFSLFEKYAEFIEAMNYTFTPEDLTSTFGTAPSDAPILITKIGGAKGVEEMVNWLLDVNDYKSYLPHPRNIDIVVPLYIAFTIITTISVALRMVSRYRVGGGLRSFDWLTFAAYLMTMGWGAVAVYHNHVIGPNEAFWDMTWDMLRENYKVMFALNLFYPWVMMVTKLSLCMFFYRMTNMNYIRWGVWATAFITIGNTLAGFFVVLFSCSPINNWDHMLSATCRSNQDRRTSLLAVGAIYIFTDVAIWALPIPMVFQLKLYPRQRILAMFTFGIGAIACIASGFRLEAVLKYYIFSSQSAATLIIDSWTIIEMNIALICSCAPAIRALVIFYKPKIKILNRSSSSTGQTGKPSFERRSEKKEIDTEKTDTKV